MLKTVRFLLQKLENCGLAMAAIRSGLGDGKEFEVMFRKAGEILFIYVTLPVPGYAEHATTGRRFTRTVKAGWKEANVARSFDNAYREAKDEYRLEVMRDDLFAMVCEIGNDTRFEEMTDDAPMEKMYDQMKEGDIVGWKRWLVENGFWSPKAIAWYQKQEAQ